MQVTLVVCERCALVAGSRRIYQRVIFNRLNEKAACTCAPSFMLCCCAHQTTVPGLLVNTPLLCVTVKIIIATAVIVSSIGCVL